MRYQLLLTVLPMALGAVVAPALQSEPSDTTDSLALPMLDSIDPALQELNSSLVTRELQKRSSFSAITCRSRTDKPRSGGSWLFHEATCDRPGGVRNGFKVACVAENQPADLNYRNQGYCGDNKVCIEFHGYNEKGNPAWDVTCVDKPQTRRWTVNAANGIAKTVGCSSGWINRNTNAVKASFEVDVLDSNGQNREGPKNIYYLLNSKPIGRSRGGDSDVGSGDIVIPPGGSVQACVESSTGFIYNVVAGLTSFGRA